VEESKTDRNLWFKYLAKLNDRAINRKMASGVTIWAIAAVFAVIFFDVIERIPLLISKPSIFSVHMLALAGTMNLTFFSFFSLICLLTISAPTIELRLETVIDKATKPILYLVTFIIILLILAVNFYSIAHAGRLGFSCFPFIIIGIYFLIQLIYFIVYTAFTILQKRENTNSSKLSTPLYLISPKNKNSYLLIIFIFLILGFILSLIPVLQALPNITTSFHIATLKWSFQVVTLIILSVYLCFKWISLFYEHHLLKLERRLILENLSSKKVHDLFMKEFLGQTAEDWLIEAEVELKKRYDKFEKALTNVELLFNELKKSGNVNCFV
jgi:hypothetical protein